MSGLSAGFFFTYQVSVVRGLALVDDANYVESFQAINATIRNAPFGIVFFGTVPSLAAALVVLRGASRPTRVLSAVALALSIAVVAITFAGNVPLNEQLAEAGSSPAAAPAAREAFETTWNRLNLARTVCSVGAAVAMAAAVVARRNVSAGR